MQKGLCPSHNLRIPGCVSKSHSDASWRNGFVNPIQQQLEPMIVRARAIEIKADMTPRGNKVLAFSIFSRVLIYQFQLD
jgi:hypothetical protein